MVSRYNLHVSKIPSHMLLAQLQNSDCHLVTYLTSIILDIYHQAQCTE